MQVLHYEKGGYSRQYGQEALYTFHTLYFVVEKRGKRGRNWNKGEEDTIDRQMDGIDRLTENKIDRQILRKKRVKYRQIYKWIDLYILRERERESKNVKWIDRYLIEREREREGAKQIDRDIDGYGQIKFGNEIKNSSFFRCKRKMLNIFESTFAYKALQ